MTKAVDLNQSHLCFIHFRQLIVPRPKSTGICPHNNRTGHFRDSVANGGNGGCQNEALMKI